MRHSMIINTTTKQQQKQQLQSMEEPQPIGYRFYPTEEELVSFYLRNKLDGKRKEMDLVIPVVNLYDVEPSQLPELSGKLCKADTEQWFFFTPRQERECNGGRTNRSTGSGYWKATGSPGYVYSSDNRVIGMKKTMVFYEGKAPSGSKTKWKMNEYKAIEMVADSFDAAATIPKLRHEFSLCRVYVVSGSFRAFDRRPLEVMSRETQLQANGAAMSQTAATMIERATTSGTSFSRGDHADLPETSRGNTWKMENQPDLLEASGSYLWGTFNAPEQPPWEW